MLGLLNRQRSDPRVPTVTRAFLGKEDPTRHSEVLGPRWNVLGTATC